MPESPNNSSQEGPDDPESKSPEIRVRRAAARTIAQNQKGISAPLDSSNQKSSFVYRDKLKLPGVFASGSVALKVAANHKFDREHYETVRRKLLSIIVVSAIGSLGAGIAVSNLGGGAIQASLLSPQGVMVMSIAFGALVLIGFDRWKEAERAKMEEETEREEMREETKREEMRLWYALENRKLEMNVRQSTGPDSL